MKFYYGVLPAGHPDIKLIDQRLRDNPPKYIACDIETVSLKDQTIIGMGIATEDGHAFYYDRQDLPNHFIIPGPTRKVWYNAPFDLSREGLGQWGSEFVDLDNIDDAIILVRMMPGINNSLEEASRLGHTNARSMKDILRQYKCKTTLELNAIDPGIVALKCCEDALATMEIFLGLRKTVNAEYYEAERRFQSILLKMSHRGILLDHDRVVAIDNELEEGLAILQAAVDTMGFNPLSSKQVIAKLHSEGVFIPYKSEFNKDVSTDKETLGKIDHIVAKTTLMYRKYNRLHSTNVHRWLSQTRVYSHFRMDAVHGRTNSVNENVQNIPTGHKPDDIRPRAGSVRSVLVPDYVDPRTNTRVGTKFDLSQIELRILAKLSNDKAMQAIFDSPDGDLHSETHQDTGLPSRTLAKNVNFGMVYGGSPEILGQFTGIVDLDIIRNIIARWREKFPTAWGWIEDQRREGLRTTEVETMYGRKLNLLSSRANNDSDKHIENCAVNWPIAGTAAEIFKRIGNSLSSWGIEDSDLVSQVHDEFWLDGPHHIPEDIEHIIPGIWTPIEQTLVERYG